MNLREVWDAVRNSPAPPYDPRLSVAMSAADYARYQNNPGHTYWLFLHKLVRQLRPKRVLELGTSIGRSALFMMTALPAKSQLVTVDIGSHRRTDLVPFDNDERLQIIYGNDLDPVVFAKVGTGFDLLFIDTEHTFEQLSAEWALYQQVLVNGAVVVMDDIYFNDGMARFWDSLPYEKVVDAGGTVHFSGFGLFKYTGRPH